ncbi:hypothetical protein [uncultured Draconibacterium sp.]|uniref:hypothetical protein n=1 Tax=uncultured Draconibacterium sp. TaxID=1573823 RepID=UPI002AA612A8|nr:hypothetical protein [uncultured Draconibacterium sp.]
MQKSIFTREELYEMIWKEPLSKLAKRLKVSEEGLKQTCVRHKIPRPNRGHWSKIKFGKSVLIPELPNYDSCETISLLEIDMEHLNIDSKRGKFLALQKQIVKEHLKMLKVPKRLINPEKEIKICIENSKDDNYKTREGFYWFGGDKLNIKVTKPHLNRAFCLMDSFLKILKNRGHKIEFRYGDTCAVIYGQYVEIYLREKFERTKTGKDYPMYDFTPCGLFVLAIDKWGGRREYVDGKQNLEEMLPKIIASMEIKAEEERQWKIENEKREKKRKIQEQEYIELERKKEKDLEDFKGLLLSSERWHKAENLRRFIDRMEESFVNRNKVLEDWLEWARKKADWYDPFVEAKDEMMVGVDRESLNRKSEPFNF